MPTARRGKIIVIADGSYKERALLMHREIAWTSTAGCGWVVGAVEADGGRQSRGPPGRGVAEGAERVPANYA